VKRWVALVVLGCASDPGVVTTTAVERGEKLASDPGFAESRFNSFACTTCHAVNAAPRILPGAPLGGAAKRPSFWGGRLTTLREAVEECAVKFMRSEPIDPSAKRWIDLWAYLESISEKGPKEAQPFTVVLNIVDLPRGSSDSGKKVYESACKTCHGAPNTGEGRLGASATVPNDTVTEHGKDGASIVRQVVVEKVRHGRYLGFPGNMPPFSKESLTDQQIGDVLTYLGLHDR
jgi:thiosulfate dehydrogenase